MAAAVMRDAAIAARRQEKHLIFERVGTERPAVTEDNRLSGPPVVVIDLRTVFGGDGGHVRLLRLYAATIKALTRKPDRLNLSVLLQRSALAARSIANLP